MKKLLLSIFTIISFAAFSQWQTTPIFSTGFDCISAFGKVYSSAASNNTLNCTSDEGVTWPLANTGVPSGGLYFGAYDGTNLYASRANTICVTASNNSWSAMSHTLTGSYNVKSMAVINSSVIAAVNYIMNPLNCQTYIKSGSSWVAYGTNYANRQFTCIRNLNGTIFAGTSGNLVIKSTDAGLTFSASSTGMPNVNNFDKYIFCLAASSTAIFAGTQNGNICRSTDNGANWTVVNGLNVTTNSLDISDIYVLPSGQILAATDSGFVYSSNNGTTWGKNNAGLTYFGGVFYDQLAKITASANYIFAATKSGKIYRRAINEIFAGINENDVVNIQSKAYPNPASGAITIEAGELFLNNKCSVKVNDVLGREVAVVEMKEGRSDLDLTNFNAGLYTYTVYNNKTAVGKGKFVVN